MRLLTLQSLFSTSPSTVSFSPDDCAPSVSTTLGYSTLASDEAASIRARQPGEAVAEAGGCHPHVRLNDPALWITPPRMHPLCCLFHSLSDCCSYGAELPAAAILEGQPASFPPAKKNNKKKKTKKRGEEINSSLKEFVRLHQKVLNIYFGTIAKPLWPWERWPSPDKSHVCPLRKKVLLLSWWIDRSWLARRANQCQNVCLSEHWQDDWIYFLQFYVNVF